MAINSAIIRIRRGPKDDLRIDKLLPGELAMATDAPVMWFCWAPGNIEQVPTSENITEIIAEIIKEYLKDNPVTGISEIYMRVADGFIQYSSDNKTWNNLLSLDNITGSDGKTAYEYAKDGGYTGTEEQFSQKLAKEYPSKTSDLENDSGFITKAVSDLANYYLKSDTYSRSEINQRLSTIPKFSIQVVSNLPLSGDSTTVYLVKSGEEESNLYTEYIYVNGRWEFLGSQSIAAGIPTKLSELTNDTGYITKAVTDLANYYNKIASDNKYQPKGNYLTEHQDLSGYAKKATTLSGYGITDGATKEEFNQLSKEIGDLKTGGNTSIKDINFHTIAHRGYHINAAQNSLQSFIDACEAGFKWIEMDIRYCADGIYILSHDPTITAYNNGTAVSVTIAESNYSDIKNYTLDAEGNYPICTFANAMAVLRKYDIGVIIDRSGGSNAELMEIAARQGMADRLMLSYQYPAKPFLEHELSVLKKYKTTPIRIVPNHYENMKKAMNELSNPIYADVNASSEEHYQTNLNIALTCGAPILFSGCKLTESNKKRWCGIACGAMADENDNFSPTEFLEAITADYSTRSNISASVDTLSIETNGTTTVTVNSNLSTIAGCLFVYSRNPMVASVTQTSFGQNISFTVTASDLEGYTTEIIVFSPNGEQIVIPVSIGEFIDNTLVYELENPVTFTQSGVGQVIDTDIALNATDKDFTICLDFVPKAETNKSYVVFSCLDEKTDSTTKSAGYCFRQNYNGGFYYLQFANNERSIDFNEIVGDGNTAFRVVLTHASGSHEIKARWTDANGNVCSYDSVATETNDTRNANTLLIGGRYGSDGNIYNSTSSSLWNGTINDFKIYERVFSESEMNAFLTV